MLFEVVTIDLHYMADRQEWFDLKEMFCTYWVITCMHRISYTYVKCI